MVELLARPSSGAVAVRWLGQGGFLFRSPGDVTWCVDPYLSDYSSSRGRIERLTPPPVAPADMRVDAVLCTHNHGDHVDPKTLPIIAEHSNARLFAAAEGAQHMREMGIAVSRVRRVAVGQYVPLGDPGRTDVHVTVVFANHSGDAVGYVCEVGAGERPVRVYVTGDTLYDERLLSPATRWIDMLCVCINGRMGNMSHVEAVQLAKQLAPQVVIPMHFGVMPHNTIDPQRFVEAAHEAGLAAAPRVLEVGEAMQFSPS